jgi:hypothetical protein
VSAGQAAVGVGVRLSVNPVRSAGYLAPLALLGAFVVVLVLALVARRLVSTIATRSGLVRQVRVRPRLGDHEQNVAVARSLRRTLEEVFARFERRPLAAASVLVHRATLRTCTASSPPGGSWSWNCSTAPRWAGPMRSSPSAAWTAPGSPGPCCAACCARSWPTASSTPTRIPATS